jgi:hypothetical protein
MNDRIAPATVKEDSEANRRRDSALSARQGPPFRWTGSA